MTEPDHLRGNALRGRNLSHVTEILEVVRRSAVDRACDDRNVAKGEWRDEPFAVLKDVLIGEVAELIDAAQNGTMDEVVHEAGDVVWCVAMICDWRRGRG